LSKSATLNIFFLVLAYFSVSCSPIFGQERPPAPNQAASPIAGSPEIATPGASPKGPELQIQALLRAANLAARNRDYSTCAQMLEQIVSIDPNYKNAWNYLGWSYNALGQYSKAEAALRKAIALNPADPQAYNNLGQCLAYQKRFDEAIPQYLKQIEVRPRDPWAHANLGRVYLITKKYQDAIGELQIAAALTPDDASILFNLGRAFAKVNEPEKAEQAFETSAELQPVPNRWNSVGYAMAEEKLNLPQAEKYVQLAIAAAAQQMRDTSLDHITKEDSSKASRIAAYWDTFGWVRFQQGQLRDAEKYLKSAWMISSSSVIADHLGQIYERQDRKAEAIQMYKIALASDSPPAETHDRLTALTAPDFKADQVAEEGRHLSKESRTIAVKNSHHVEGFAEFWILLSPGPTVRGVKFANGDEELEVFEKDLQGISYSDSFPEATEIRLLRRGRLSCVTSSPDCRLLLMPSVSVPTDDLPSATPSVAGDAGRVALSGAVAAAKILKKVQPIYPPEARLNRIEGVVRLKAVIGKDGAVKQLTVVSGHPTLAQAAIDAVGKWIYQPTLLEGRPVEVETEIDVNFQLTGN
jgi:TonB family protein